MTSKNPLRDALIWSAIIVTFVLVTTWGAFAQQPQSNPAQEQVERTIGSLVIGNATLGAQNAALTAELNKVRKELADLKAKNAPPQEPKK